MRTLVLLPKTLVAIALLVLCNCSYVGMVYRYWQLRTLGAPTPGAAIELNYDLSITVYGKLVTMGDLRGDAAIVALIENGGGYTAAASAFTCASGYYSLVLVPGYYRLAVFADKNGDRLFTNNECIGLYPRVLEVSPAKSSSGIIGGITIFAAPALAFEFGHPLTIPMPSLYTCERSAYYPPGTIKSLGDTLFSHRNAELGIYYPSQFLNISNRYLYALRERNPQRTPVVFVHGYGGSPRQFEPFMQALDTSRYDVWLFYYPSGQNVDRSARVFHEIFLSGNIIDLKNRHLKVIAHSMGGLVVRRALGIRPIRKDARVDFISLCTPWGGVADAAFGVKKAPVVIPSWRDIDPGSSLLHDLFSSTLPQGTRLFLLFGYQSRSSRLQAASDGLVTLKSQLREEAQMEASGIYGFNETHGSILTSAEAIERVVKIIGK